MNFGSLPQLLDRNFVTGYFLPIAAFAAASYGLVTGFGLPTSFLDSLATNNKFLNTTIIVLVWWLLAALLLSINRPIYMLKEGYGRWNPVRLLLPLERRRYYKLMAAQSEVTVELRELLRHSKSEIEKNRVRTKRRELMRMLAEQFPEDRDLLPTRFGNTLRAFEVYPRVIYGLEGVEGWNRLRAVMPKEYQDLVEDSKAQTDFYLNLWFLSLLIILEYVAIVVYIAGSASADFAEHWWMSLFVPAIIVFAFLASRGARIAAVEWGDMVKASYDTFLPDLSKKLGFISSEDTRPHQEKKLWTLF